MDNEIELKIEEASAFLPQAIIAEEQRISNEENRNSAEVTRIANETTRIANETTRIANETTRIAQYNQLVEDTQDQIDEKYSDYTNAIEGLYEEIAYNSFDNVATMKACTRLEAGATVQTLGYYSVNDGGAATYKIRVKTSSDVEDNGSILFVGNNLVAELVVENDTVNVKQFGAKGDGINNDTVYIQNALKVAGNNNITIKFAAADKYCISNTINLYSNTNIDLCNQKLKCGASVLFRNYDVTQIENIEIVNGAFEGGTSSQYASLLKFGLLKASNIKINKVIFEKCGYKSHIFDLGGCKNVTIENCYFHNIVNNQNEELCELIQLDYANAEYLPYWNDTTNNIYDNSACENIIIKNNKFYQDNKSTYGKINAIGTHSTVSRKIHKNIFIDRNEFDDPSYSTIKPLRWTNFEITNNTFINETDNSTTTSSIFINNGIVDLGNNNYDFIPYENVKINGNKFINKNSNDNKNRCIYIQGGKKNNDEYYHKNVQINDNISIGSYTNSTIIGNDFLTCNYIDELIISNNLISKAKNVIYSANMIKNVNVINNRFESCRTSYSISSSENLLFDKNMIIDSSNNYSLLNTYYDDYVLNFNDLTMQSGFSFSNTWLKQWVRNGNTVIFNAVLVSSAAIASSTTDVLVIDNVVPSELRPKTKGRFQITGLINNNYGVSGNVALELGPTGDLVIRNTSGVSLTNFLINIVYHID